jgi:hypothetical protein
MDADRCGKLGFCPPPKKNIFLEKNQNLKKMSYLRNILKSSNYFVKKKSFLSGNSAIISRISLKRELVRRFPEHQAGLCF